MHFLLVYLGHLASLGLDFTQLAGILRKAFLLFVFIACLLVLK